MIDSVGDEISISNHEITRAKVFLVIDCVIGVAAIAVQGPVNRAIHDRIGQATTNAIFGEIRP